MMIVFCFLLHFQTLLAETRKRASSRRLGPQTRDTFVKRCQTKRFLFNPNNPNSAAKSYAVETLSTLKFATRVKFVQNKVKHIS
jgi:hypothetical protein